VPKKILIVDDEEGVVSFLSFALTKAGYDTISAFDGKEGFEKARDIKPDLIILDLMLPKVDGYWVCDLLKKDKRYSGTRIIMITAKADEEAIELANKCGADGYILKPFKLDDVLNKVKDMLKDVER